MANNGASNDRLCSGKDEMDCAETTMVEIKIKTLDSQTYTMRVDKCVPVPALKEQIASVTGVLSEQQRLICRGKVLKDDQLLSAYHVEDGHTLHLVVRQPIAPSSEGTPNPDRDPTTTSGRVQGSGGPTVLVSSFNISEQDGELSTSRFLSALLGSLGMANFGSGPEGVDLNETPSERISNATGQRNISRQPPEVSVSGQPFISSGAFSFPAVDPMESLQAPVIPDSLTTLTQNLSRLRQEFVANVEAQSSSIHQGAGFQGTAGQNIDASSFSAPQRGGLPTPASLADVLLTTRQLLNEHVAESLSLLARQLQGHANITDASERARIQNNTLRSGALIHNLGALLLELARTTITMRMGQTPADGIVNAGPAVFISPTGPNPIMVQVILLYRCYLYCDPQGGLVLIFFFLKHGMCSLFHSNPVLDLVPLVERYNIIWEFLLDPVERLISEYEEFCQQMQIEEIPTAQGILGRLILQAQITLLVLPKQVPVILECRLLLVRIKCDFPFCTYLLLLLTLTVE
ncbi:OLC1v1027965C1 [Oldenlandia corymbosa var. corymbosa]|uniref:OLC1v1027965C1 n=1 Tax=Oldenlandia corymbosa var. corymbosa TaxID=529605 RepID=A0AAV1CCN4_OLDCO|nr:OLC1v1027965C1 [Oldenlandia corymbosa var. corymbosa]